MVLHKAIQHKFKYCPISINLRKILRAAVYSLPIGSCARRRAIRFNLFLFGQPIDFVKAQKRKRISTAIPARKLHGAKVGAFNFGGNLYIYAPFKKAMSKPLILLFLLTFGTIAAQKVLPPPMIANDSLYREDQFYIGFTYNMLMIKPKGFHDRKFSSGFTGGFVRDFPFNKQRNKAFGVGLGATYNKYFQDMIIARGVDGQNQYSIIEPGKDYKKNKFDEVLIDIPLEYRYRTSTAASHKFFRVYSGLRASYVLYNKSRFTDNEFDLTYTGNKDYNPIRLSAFTSLGYNTWNFYAAFGLTPIFKSSAKIDGKSVELHPLHLGIVFYIL